MLSAQGAADVRVTAAASQLDGASCALGHLSLLVAKHLSHLHVLCSIEARFKQQPITHHGWAPA